MVFELKLKLPNQRLKVINFILLYANLPFVIISFVNQLLFTLVTLLLLISQ